MKARRFRYAAVLLLPLWFGVGLSRAENDPGFSPGLGEEADSAEVDKWNLDIFPDGRGLPKGFGSAVSGKKVYEIQCLQCHGPEGAGDSADELAGAMHSLTDDPPDKTIGTYWPYATTIFDFVRRSMPLHAPGSLSNGEIYSLTAYLLFLNGIVDEDDIIDAATLPAVEMPNRYGFINNYEKTGRKR
ncbi:MAG: c-type cytochrome [Gammaproteobacteria bacterium]